MRKCLFLLGSIITHSLSYENSLINEICNNLLMIYLFYLQESCCFGAGSNSTPALYSRSSHKHQIIHHRYSVREGKRKHKIARFYSSENGNY